MHRLIKLIKKIPYVIKNPKEAIIYILTHKFSFLFKDPEAARLFKWQFGKMNRVAITEIFPGIEKVSVTIEKLFDRKIGTSLDAYEIVILSAITKFLKAKNILEIGTWDGNTALNLAASSPPDALVTTLDLPLNFVKGISKTYLNTNNLNLTNRKKVGIQYKNTMYENKIIQVYGDSAEINWNTLGGPFDLIFIDGSHTYLYVKNDTEKALMHLKPKGIIIWHDYGMIKDVSKVVDEAAIKTKAIRGSRLAVGFRLCPL